MYMKKKNEELPVFEIKCETCLGCNRLLDPNFKGTIRCDGYVKGVDKNESNENDG